MFQPLDVSKDLHQRVMNTPLVTYWHTWGWLSHMSALSDCSQIVRLLGGWRSSQEPLKPTEVPNQVSWTQTSLPALCYSLLPVYTPSPRLHIIIIGAAGSRSWGWPRARGLSPLIQPCPAALSPVPLHVRRAVALFPDTTDICCFYWSCNRRWHIHLLLLNLLNF